MLGSVTNLTLKVNLLKLKQYILKKVRIVPTPLLIQEAT